MQHASRQFGVCSSAFVQAQSLCLLSCLLLSTSCGRAVFLKSRSSTPPNEPTPPSTVLPTVPVVASYLTTVLLDEEFKPLPDTEISAFSGRLSVRSDAFGRFTIPVSYFKDNQVDFDVIENRQVFSLRAHVPLDISESIKKFVGTAGRIIPRVMAVRMSRLQQSPAANDSFTRQSAVTFSIPTSLLVDSTSGKQLLSFAVQSHMNGDTVGQSVNLSGECVQGHKIKVTGALIQPAEVNCQPAGESGSFQMGIALTQPEGLKLLMVTQTDPANGNYIAQLLLLKLLNPFSLRH